MRPPTADNVPPDLITFASYLWQPDDLVEIRAIRGAETPRRWVNARDLGRSASDLARLNAQGFNIYAGVAPRCRRNGGSAKDIKTVRVVYADIDHCTVDDAFARLATSGLPRPGLIVASGNGVHFYWRLGAVVTGDDLQSVPRLIASIAAALRSDPKVKDLPRIMRVPGFSNVKDPKNPKPCFIVECCPEAAITVDQLTDALRIAESRATCLPTNHVNQSVGSDGQSPISRGTAEFLEHGAPPGERNHGLFAAACDLVGCGWDEVKARESLLIAAAKCGLPTEEAEATITSAFSKPRTPSNGHTPPPSGLPEIKCNGRQFRETIDDAWRVLREHGSRSPRFFNRFRRVVHIVNSDGPQPFIEAVSEGVMYGSLLRMADWYTVSEQGRKLHIAPPTKIAHDMLAYPNWLLPELKGVALSPSFACDGSLIHEPGYSKVHRVFLAPHGAAVLQSLVSEHPTPVEVNDAITLLLGEWLGDFPFVSQADRANAVAALILPVVRQMIAGPTPIHAFVAPAAGTGKSLLCELFGIVTTGRSTDVRPMPTSDDELRKRITSELMRGWPIIAFDNVRASAMVDSSALASVITSINWSDRELGASKMVTLPNLAAWYLTGNNLSLSRELARRAIMIRLDAQCETPSGRGGFRISNIRKWTVENRPRLFRALVVLVRHWIAEGSPLAQVPFGSFEDWAGVVGGIIRAAGIIGFLGNLDEARRGADAESREFRAFVQAWWDAYREAPVCPTDLERLCEANDLLRDERGNKGQRSRVTSLGFALRKRVGSIVAGFKIVVDDGRKGNEYRLSPAGGPPAPSETPNVPNLCRTSGDGGSAPEVLMGNEVMSDCRTCQTFGAIGGQAGTELSGSGASDVDLTPQVPMGKKVRQVRQGDENALKQGELEAEPPSSEVRQGSTEVRQNDGSAFGDPT